MIGTRHRCKAVSEIHFVSPEDREETLAALPSGFVKDTIVHVREISQNAMFYELYVESLDKHVVMESWAFSAWFEAL